MATTTQELVIERIRLTMSVTGTVPNWVDILYTPGLPNYAEYAGYTYRLVFLSFGNGPSYYVREDRAAEYLYKDSNGDVDYAPGPDPADYDGFAAWNNWFNRNGCKLLRVRT